MMPPYRAFLAGLVAPLDGLQMLFRSGRLFALAIVPVLLGCLMMMGGLFYLAQFINPWVASMIGGWDWLTNWETLAWILSWAMAVFTWLVATIFIFVVGYLIIMLVAGPFYALMAEEVFRQEKPDEIDRSGWRLMLSMFMVALLKVIIFSVVGIICFILSWIPGLNLLAGLVIFAMIAFDCSDYSFEVDVLSLSQRFQFFFSHIWHYAGLATAVFATSFVPGSFFILLPAFICGTTKMYIQLQHKTV